MQETKLGRDFFIQDVLDVAPKLIGKLLCRKLPDNTVIKSRIIETEAYNGNGDLACHATKGKTERTKAFFYEGGHVYIYLCYGIHWLLNIVTGNKDEPQAVLIRAVEEAIGPGRVGKYFHLDKSHYGEDLTTSNVIWIEDDGINLTYISTPRIGIDYAGEPWISKKWRFVHETTKKTRKSKRIQ